ncbi:MAG: LCP family protein [bacterium]
MSSDSNHKKSIFKKIILCLGIALFLICALAGAAIYKTGSVYVKMSDGKNSLWRNILSLLPLEKNSFANKILSEDSVLNSETERVNIAILGIRGEDDPNGGLLADTIMIASILRKENQLALISIPRDLYVKVPRSKSAMQKINSVYAFGQKNDKQGLEFMKEILQTVSGLEIHYAVSVDFEAFEQTVDLLDGITVHVPRDLTETQQWQGQPFHISAGDQKMNGETALLYARARYSTSDFDRARRQQEILIAIRNKALSAGILMNPLKINSLMDIIGDNVKMDFTAWEVKEVIKIARDLDLTNTKRRVFDSSEAGLLEAKTTDAGEFILVPRGSTYEKIQEECEGIFN